MHSLLRLALWVERQCSHPVAIVWASAIIFVWVAGGFALGWSAGWLNVGTFAISIPPYFITFFILVAGARSQKSAEVRDVAMHKKLDEILRAIPQARNELIGIETRAEEI